MVLDGDITEDEPGSDCENSLVEVAVEEAEENGGGHNGKNFAIAAQSRESNAAENDLFHDRSENTGV